MSGSSSGISGGGGGGIDLCGDESFIEVRRVFENRRQYPDELISDAILAFDFNAQAVISHLSTLGHTDLHHVITTESGKSTNRSTTGHSKRLHTKQQQKQILSSNTAVRSYHSKNSSTAATIATTGTTKRGAGNIPINDLTTTTTTVAVDKTIMTGTASLTMLSRFQAYCEFVSLFQNVCSLDSLKRIWHHVTTDETFADTTDTELFHIATLLAEEELQQQQKGQDKGGSGINSSTSNTTNVACATSKVNEKFSMARIMREQQGWLEQFNDIFAGALLPAQLQEIKYVISSVFPAATLADQEKVDEVLETAVVAACERFFDDKNNSDVIVEERTRCDCEDHFDMNNISSTSSSIDTQVAVFSCLRELFDSRVHSDAVLKHALLQCGYDIEATTERVCNMSAETIAAIDTATSYRPPSYNNNDNNSSSGGGFSMGVGVVNSSSSYASATKQAPAAVSAMSFVSVGRSSFNNNNNNINSTGRAETGLTPSGLTAVPAAPNNVYTVISNTRSQTRVIQPENAPVSLIDSWSARSLYWSARSSALCNSDLLTNSKGSRSNSGVSSHVDGMLALHFLGVLRKNNPLSTVEISHAGILTYLGPAVANSRVVASNTTNSIIGGYISTPLSTSKSRNDPSAGSSSSISHDNRAAEKSEYGWTVKSKKRTKQGQISSLSSSSSSSTALGHKVTDRNSYNVLEVRLDLHGLYVVPAIQFVKSVLQYYKASDSADGAYGQNGGSRLLSSTKRKISIRFIVGRGIHSPGGVARLGPQVWNYLQRNCEFGSVKRAGAYGDNDGEISVVI